MAAVDSKLKQRIIGAVVLIALAVIFLPMLFKKDDPARDVVVQAPAMPEVPVAAPFVAQEVAVPEPVLDPAYAEWDEPIELDVEVPRIEVVTPAAENQAAVAQAPVTVTPAPASVQAAQPAVAPGLDKNNLPVSWSVQLANLTDKANAEALRDTYRGKQYNAYVRSAAGTHRVLIGPLVKQAEAQAMCKSLKSREGQDCFVVRYQP